MKVKFEISWILIQINSGTDNRMNGKRYNDIIPKEMVLERLMDKKERLKESINDTNSQKRMKSSKNSLKHTKKAIKQVKNIDEWEEFQKSILEGDYTIGDSHQTLNGMGVF